MIREQANRIGRMIATARRNRGWSLRQLGNETGISHTWLRKLERGDYLSPASDLLIRVADALSIDLERIDRIAEGQMSDSLPTARTYFRAKYNLSAEDIDQIERTMQDIQRNHEGGTSHDSNRNQNSDTTATA
jgi:transcriptional regulator with XRE-family HTH domain